MGHILRKTGLDEEVDDLSEAFDVLHSIRVVLVVDGVAGDGATEIL